MSLYMEEEGAVTLSFDTEETAKIVTEAALDYIGCPYEAEINLLLTTNDEIREMNRMFRQIDKPTDVLSFPMLEYETPGDFSFVEEEAEAFNPESGELMLGDIVISSDALQHDFDVTGLGYKKSVIPGMETSVFTADTELVEMAKEACEIVNPEIQCFVGRVVTGDQFISDNGTKAALVKDYDGYCADMEGASMAQVATLNKIPFVIIRAISDKADNSAPVAYETFEEQAIVHTVKLLAAMFLKMSK